MANITDQFVTSFSELHINGAAISSTIGDTGVRDFFTGGRSTAADTTIVIGATGTAPAASAIADGSTTAQLVRITDTTGTDVYFLYTIAATVTAANYADVDAVVTAMTEAGSTFVSAQVPLVMEIGTLSNEATVIDTPTFGEVYRGKLRGQLDGGQLDAQLYWAPRNFVHSLLRTLAETGTALSAGIKWNSNSTGTDSEFVVFNSFVSSFGIDTTFDDVAKVSATLVVDGAEHFADDE